MNFSSKEGGMWLKKNYGSKSTFLGAGAGAGAGAEARVGQKQTSYVTLMKYLSKKFSAHSLVAEFCKFSRTLIANQKCKLAVAAKWS